MVSLVKQDFEENKKLYSILENEITKKIGNDYPITHVGSTVVPNMYGKNIIDILIGVNDNIEFEIVTDKLIELGYFGSEKSKDEIYRFFASTESETGSGDVHIHLVIIGTERYNDFIILKNYLLSNDLEVKNYSDFKQEIIEKDISDRKEYKRIKSEYVTNLLLRAREYYNKQ